MSRLPGVLLVLALAFVSCGDDDDEGGAGTAAATSEATTTTTIASSTTTSTTSSTSTSKGTTSKGTTSAPASPPTTEPPGTATSTAPGPGTATTAPSETMTSFATPSGNILCAMNADSGVRCDIGEVEWTPPPKPADCEFDWGSHLQLEEEASFACVSDTPFDEQPEVVPYGTSVRQGIYTCEVERSGVTCRNTETGAGFEVSRGGYELLEG
jgi:hypothetical protein